MNKDIEDIRKQVEEIQKVAKEFYNIKLLCISFYNLEDKKYIETLEQLDKELIKRVERIYIDVSFSGIEWFMKEYIKAIIQNTNILIERIKLKDELLFEDRIFKNRQIIKIVDDVISNSSININDNLFFVKNGILEKKIEGDYEVYYIKDIPFFRNSLKPITDKKEFYFHGTLLSSAKKIVKDKFKQNGYIAESFYNNGKIFFSDDFKTSQKYSYKNFENGVVFKVKLNDYELYSREHLLIGRENPISYFVKDEDIEFDAIQNIYYIENEVIKEVDKNTLLILKESTKTWQK